MMTLQAASAFFDRTEALDPYTGVKLFMCQIDPFDESKRDSSTSYRRVMSVADGTVIPEHRSIEALGVVWVVGDPEPDGMESIHRKKYVLVPTTGRLKISTLAEFLGGTHQHNVWASVSWARDDKSQKTTSAPAQMYDIFIGREAPTASILWSDTRAFLVNSWRPMPSGLGCAHSLMLEAGAEPATITTRTFNIATGGYQVVGQLNTQCLRVRWQNLFEYDAQTDRRFEEGDLSVVVPSSVEIGLLGQLIASEAGVGLGTVSKTTSQLEVSGTRYQVLEVNTRAGVKVLHCRRT